MEQQRRPPPQLHRSPSSISTLKTRLFGGSVASSRSQMRGQTQEGARGQGQQRRQEVEIIRDISHLDGPQPQRWDVWGGANRFDGGPDHKGTVNVGWLVGTPSSNGGGDNGGHHIDIYEHSQAQPPSHLNVKDSPSANPNSVVVVDHVVAAAPAVAFEAKASGTDLDRSVSSERWLQQQPSYQNLWDGTPSKSNKSTNTTNSSLVTNGGRPPNKQGYSLKRSKTRFRHLQQQQGQSSEDEAANNMNSLKRSKSVCDIPEQLSLGPVASTDIEVASVNSGAAARGSSRLRSSVRSRVVRNRTILGSFPLFYKLSQSLSSLNTNSRGNTIESRGGRFGGDFNDCSNFVEDQFER